MTHPFFTPRLGDIVLATVPGGSSLMLRFDRSPDGYGAFYDALGASFAGAVAKFPVPEYMAEGFEATERENGVCRCRGTGFIAHGSRASVTDPDSLEPCGCSLLSCDECCGEGTVIEHFEPVPGGGMPGDDLMGESVRVRIPCRVCKGSGTAPRRAS